jgi:hypothetical protein
VKLQGYRETFYTFSGKLSDVCRQLAFAVLLPGALVVSVLALDLLQYALGSILWRVFYQRREREKVGEDVEIDHSDGWEIPIWIVFCLKTVCIAVAYGFLLDFFIRTIALR